MNRFLIAICSICLLGSTTSRAAQAQPVDFRREVLPILSENCFSCHGFDEAARQAELRLDSFEGATREAESGSFAIVPGNVDDSELLARIFSDDADLRMPPAESERHLTETQQEILRRWIAEGAKYQQHWAFERPAEHEPPPTKNVKHPIDRFIQYRLAQANITPAPRASDEALVRRIFLDLVGLPPSVAEIDQFLQDATADRVAATEKLIDRLLESPHYGERWGRWWLDQARYADSNGYSIDAPRQIWKYRDWVVEALNADMPFDQFTVEQLAGDLLPNATQSQKIATGFHRNTQINQEGGIDKEQFRIDSVFDRVATTGTVWLGLTVGCAQCHDHKFDPILQKEYYQLFAFFNNQDEPTLKVTEPAQSDPVLLAKLRKAEDELHDYMASRQADYEAWEAKLTADEIGKFRRSAKRAVAVEAGKRTREQARELFGIEVGKIDNGYQALLRSFNKIHSTVHGVTTTLVMAEREQPRTSHLFIKGDFTRPSDVVTPNVPSVLHPLAKSSDQQASPDQGQPLNRLDLAHWIVSKENPLMARVIVNRVWQVYFGRGLVETENDFGTLGSPPTHPELLDWLALKFQESWSLKELHRLIVSSHTYQQSSKVRAELANTDPENYLLARQTRLRLEAELIRDVCLSVSGLISKKLGGPPVYPPIPEGVMNRGQVNRKWVVSKGEDRYRRGLYTFVFRATPPPSLNVFDAPDGFGTCTRRSRSNTPLQALTLLNDSSFVEFAKAIESRIKEHGIQQVFRETAGRAATSQEIETLQTLDSLGAARVLLNLDETVTRN